MNFIKKILLCQPDIKLFKREWVEAEFTIYFELTKSFF